MFGHGEFCADGQRYRLPEKTLTHFARIAKILNFVFNVGKLIKGRGNEPIGENRNRARI
jgi:hypothetical protein